jgi:Mitochondrial carrier protein
MTKNDNLPLHMNVIFSCSSAGIAELITLPLDTIKVNIQTAPNKTKIYPIIDSIWTKYGVKGFYNSVFASIGRQTTMTGIRLGLYDYYKPQKGQIMVGAMCGLVGNLASMPFDVLKTKMQKNPKEYRTTIQSITKIYNAKHLKGFYVGLVPTVQRSMLISGVQLPLYTNLQKMIPIDNLFIRTTMVSVITTMIVTSVVYPFDLCKSIMMTQKDKQTVFQILKDLKLRKIYNGVSVGVGRAIPHFLITTICYEKFKELYNIK